MPDERESEGGKRERSGALAVAVLLLHGLLALYLLATGPINWLHKHGYVGDSMDKVIMYIYRPIQYVIQHSELLRSIFKAWCDWWRN